MIIQHLYLYLPNVKINCVMFQTAVDIGGPRKEFFRLILNEIKEKYFDKGLREHLESDYVLVGSHG